MKNCKQIATEWGLSERTVNDLCKKNKIDGAIKVGKMWKIPDDAKKPIDGRITSGKYVRHSAGVTRKPLPIGISDYVRAQADYYYVDKTMLIKEFLDQKPLVSLFTRPRRFGKTLNMDMLRVFFEISEENTSKYFEDKAIWQCGEEYRNQQGQYPVVFLTFKDVKFDSWKATLDKIRDLLQEEFGRHQELATSERIAEYEKTYFAKIINGDASEVDLTASLAKLSQMLTKKDFFISIIGSNEINNNKYEKILKAVGMTCTEMADNEIRTDKMEILIKTKIMTMTLKNLHFLRSDYDKLVWIFIIANPVEYFEIMTPEEWDDRELRKLYEWYPQEQREICDKIYEIAKQDFNEIIQECKSLHPQLINRLLDCNEFTIAQKKTILANAVQTNKISIEEVKKRLYELGMEQVISAFEGKRPTVEAVEENRVLLDSFQIKNWISKFERDKNKRGVYRIVGKKAKGMSSREN